jgi:hypothetical protein
VLDELRAELRDAKARGDETIKKLRAELIVQRTTITPDGTVVDRIGTGDVIDITPSSSSVIRKTRSSDAA